MNNSRRRILVVQDDPETVWRIGKTLTQTGFSVCTTGDGLEAIDLLKTGNYETVITDLGLRGLNGLSLVDWLRKNRPTVKILVVTDFDSPPVRKLCADKGALCCLGKPVDLELLTGVLSSLDEEHTFSGSVNEIDILDYVQLMMLTGRQLVLEVCSGDGCKGRLHIESGSVIHAECDGLEGEDAAYKCLSFTGGTFANLPWRRPETQTVHQPGEFLLIEAARRRDETGTDCLRKPA
jgi:CheY-like chemotaxis protein